MGSKYSNDEVKQALNGDASALTEEEQEAVRQYKPNVQDKEDIRKDRLSTFFKEQKTAGQHTTPNTGPLNFVQTLQKAQADINQQQVNSAQAVFQRKKEVLPAVTEQKVNQKLTPPISPDDPSVSPDDGAFDREAFSKVVMGAESTTKLYPDGGDPNALNKMSGALGPYQFMPDTWDSLVKNYPNSGLLVNGRSDPAQQEIAHNLLIDENEVNLKGKGFPVTNGNMYVMHTLGAGDGSTILQAARNGDTRLASKLLPPKVVEQNPTWFTNKPTPQELVDLLANKVTTPVQSQFTTAGDPKTLEPADRNVPGGVAKKIAESDDSNALWRGLKKGYDSLSNIDVEKEWEQLLGAVAQADDLFLLGLDKGIDSLKNVATKFLQSENITGVTPAQAIQHIKDNWESFTKYLQTTKQDPNYGKEEEEAIETVTVDGEEVEVTEEDAPPAKTKLTEKTIITDGMILAPSGSTIESEIEGAIDSGRPEAGRDFSDIDAAISGGTGSVAKDVDKQFEQAPLKNTSPVTEQFSRNVVKHEDGTWSVITHDGKWMSGLNEIIAKSYGSYHAENMAGLTEGAPQEDWRAYRNQAIASLAMPIELLAHATVGATTLQEVVDDWNDGNRGATDLLGPRPGWTEKSDISQADLEAFRAGKLSKDDPKFKTLTELNAQVTTNKAQYDSISKMAEEYRGYFPVNRKHIRGAVTAYKLIAEHHGDGAAILSAFDNLGVFMEQGFDSIGFTLALTLGNVPIQIGMLSSLAKGRAAQMKEQFKLDNNGREANREERVRINMSAAASLAIEKASLVYMGKVVEGMPIIGSPVEWANKVAGAINKNLPASLATRGIVKPATSFAGEGVQEFGSQTIEHVGLTGELPSEPGAFSLPFVEGSTAGPIVMGTIGTGVIAGKIAGKAIEPSKAKQQKQQFEQAKRNLDIAADNITSQERINDLDQQISSNEKPIDEIVGGVETDNDRFIEIYKDLRKQEFKHTDALTEAKKLLKEETAHLKQERDQLAKDTNPVKMKDTSLRDPIVKELNEVTVELESLKTEAAKDAESKTETRPAGEFYEKENKLTDRKKVLEEKLEANLNPEQLKAHKTEVLKHQARINKTIKEDNFKQNKQRQQEILGGVKGTQGQGTKLTTGELPVLLKEIEVIATSDPIEGAALNTGEPVNLNVTNDYVPEEDSGLVQTKETEGGAITKNTVELKPEDPAWLDKKGQRLTEKDFSGDPVAYKRFKDETEKFDANRKKGIAKLAELKKESLKLSPEQVNPVRRSQILAKLEEITNRDLSSDEKKIVKKRVDKLKEDSVLSPEESKSVADKLYSGPDAFSNSQESSSEDLQKAIDDPNISPETKTYLEAVQQAQKDSVASNKNVHDKDFLEVHADIISGEAGTRFKGLHTYRDDIIALFKNPDKIGKRALALQIQNQIDSMNTHSVNLTNKLFAFNKAAALNLSDPAGIGSVWAVRGVLDPIALETNKDSRKMNYSVEKMTEADYTQQREGEGLFLNRIDVNSSTATAKQINGSKKLIKGLSQEVKLGKSAVAAVVSYPGTSIQQTSQSTVAEAANQKLYGEALDEYSEKLETTEAVSDAAIDDLKATDEKKSEKEAKPSFKEGDIVNVWNGDPKNVKSNMQGSQLKITKIFDEGEAGIYVQVEGENTLHPIENIELAGVKEQAKSPTIEEQLKTAKQKRETATDTNEKEKLDEEIRNLESLIQDSTEDRTEEAPPPDTDGGFEGKDDIFNEAPETSEPSPKSAEQSDTAETAETEEGTPKFSKKIVQSFIDSAVKAYETVIKEATVENLERMLGMLNAYFSDLIQIGPSKEDLKTAGLHTLRDIDFIWTQEDVDEGKYSDAKGNIGKPTGIKLYYALIELGMSKVGAKALAQRFSTFKKRYEKVRLDKAVNNFALTEPLSILLRDDTLPDQVLFGMMIGVMSFRQQTPNNKRFTSDWQKEQFLYSGKNSDLSSDENTELDKLGYSYNDTAIKIGRDVTTLLKMSAKTVSKDSTVSQDGANLYFENLVPALGMMAIEIAQGEDTGALFQVLRHTWNFADDNVKGRNFNNADKTDKSTASYYRHIKIPETTVRGIITPQKVSKEGAKAVDELVKSIKAEINTHGDKPFQEPQGENIPKDIKGSLGSIPRKVKTLLKKLQNQKWNAAESMDTVAALEEHLDNKDVLHALIGVVNIPSGIFHESHVDSLKSSNQDKLSDLQEILDAYKDPDNLLTDFYFKYELQNHHRILMQGRINPQHSKVTRFLLKSWEAQTYNADNIWKFKLAVAQNFGLEVDKNKLDFAEMAFDDIMENENVQDAVKALRNIQQKKGDPKEQAEKLASALDGIKKTKTYADGNMSIINAVTALANYKPNGEFKSDIVMEVDGISNGFAMNVMQFPMFENLDKILNQIGNYFDVRSPHDPNQDDIYETLVGHVVDGMTAKQSFKYYSDNSWKDTFNHETYAEGDPGGHKAGDKIVIHQGTPANPLDKDQLTENSIAKSILIDRYKERDGALNIIYSKFLDPDSLRKVVKYPFLIFMYGGGIDRISKDVSKDIIKGIYERAGVIQKEYSEQSFRHSVDGVTTPEQTNYFDTTVKEFVDSLDTLGAFKQSKDSISKEKFEQAIKEGKSLNKYFNEKQLTALISRTLTPRFDYGLDTMLGETKKARNTVVEMGEMMHEAFMLQYRKAYDEKLAEKNEAHKQSLIGTEGEGDYAKRPRLTKQEIKDLIQDVDSKLRKVFPQYAGPLSQILQDKDGNDYIEGAIDLTSTEFSDPEGKYSLDENRVEVTVKGSNGKKKWLNTFPSQLRFIEPGVSALIRQIINMDSVALTQTLNGTNRKGDPRITEGFTNTEWAGDTQLLMLHDAFMGSPEQLSMVSEIYGKIYLAYSLKHSIIEKTYNQLEKVIKLTKAIDTEIDPLTGKMYAEDNYPLMQELEEIYNRKQEDRFVPADKLLSVDQILARFKGMKDSVLEEREKLRQRIKDEGMVSHQMYMARPASGQQELVKSARSFYEFVMQTQVEPAVEKRKEDAQETSDAYLLFENAEGKKVYTNEDQTNAIKKMKNWWDKKLGSIFVLQGRGGTGKTTIVNKALEILGIGATQVRFALPTHKAKQVIMEAAQDFDEDQFSTLAKLLGQKRSWDDKAKEWTFINDLDKLDKSKKELNEKGIRLLVIDEASMISEDFTKKLQELAEDLNIRIIFMGDNVQLPPIEKLKAMIGKISLSTVFDNVMGFNKYSKKLDLGIDKDTSYAELTKRMRQSNESPILGITDIIANMVIDIFERAVLDPKQYDGKGTNILFTLPDLKETGELDGVHYMDGTTRGPSDTTINKFVKEYEKDPAKVKYIHFNNEVHERTIALRAKIRELLFPNEKDASNLKARPFIKSERIVLSDIVGVVTNPGFFNGQNTEEVKPSEDLHNGDEVTVIEELRDQNISFSLLADGASPSQGFKNIPSRILKVRTDPTKKDPKGRVFDLAMEDKRPATVTYTNKDGVEVTAKTTVTKAAIHKAQEKMAEHPSKDGRRMKNLLKYFPTYANKALESAFTSEPSAAYLINVHKAQGSTYHTVYADYTNIMGPNGSPDWLTKLSSLYVATSRPTTRLVLVGNGQLKYGNGTKELDANIEIVKDMKAAQIEEEVIKEVDEKLKTLDDLPKDPTNEATNLGDITKDNIKKLFNKFKSFSFGHYDNKQEMNDHTETLNVVLNILNEGIAAVGGIKLTVQHINGITQGEYDIASKSMGMFLSNNAPFSNNSQSPQEVYVHELLHATTALAIRENPLVAGRIERLYTQTEDALNAKYGEGKGYKVFLAKGIMPSANDITMAKRQYNYVFKGKEKAKLHEFLAYAVTNKQMIDFLKTQPRPVREGILGKLLDLVSVLIDIIKESFGARTYRNISGNAFMEMIAATEHLVAIQAKHESKYQQQSAKTYAAMDKSDKFLRQFAEDIAVNVAGDPGDPKSRLRKTASTITGGLNVIFGENQGAIRARQMVDRALNKTLRGISNEVGAGVLTKDMIKQLLHVKVNISKARQQAETFTTKWFNGDPEEGIKGIWKSVDPLDPHAMSVKTKIALTEIMLRTDLSALRNKGTEFELSHKEIMDLIGNDKNTKAARKAKQNDIARKLKLLHSSDALRYANELGHHIVTNKTRLNRANMNAKSIALDYLQNPTDEQIALIDTYATLSALNHTQRSQDALVKNLSNKEFDKDGQENGMIEIIDYHLEYKKNSKKDLFSGNATQMVKGYIIERVDNFTHMKVGTKADIPKMKAAGYSEHYELTKIDPSQTYDTLFVTRTIPEVTDVSGVMSTTNQRNMGTTLTEILVRDPAFQHTKGPNKGLPDFFKIKVKVQKFIADQERAAAKNVEWDDSLKLRPVFDENNKITDYRVLMDNEWKTELLQPDLEFQNVFAHMRSAAVDRKETIISDKKTVELLVYEQMDMMKTNPDLKWIDIMDPDSPYIDRYRKLPREVRELIKSYAVNGQFMVREDIVDKVFGYKSFDLTQLKVLQSDGAAMYKRIAGVTHHAIKQTVSYGKNRIVIAMPQVVFGNMMSNIYQLLMRKIPIDFIFNKIYEGISEYNKYDNDTKERTRLNAKIRAKGLDNKTSDEAIKVARLNDRIEGNLIHRMSAAGLNSLIVEDINDSQTDGYLNKLKKTIPGSFPAAQKYIDNIPPFVGDVASFLFMTKNSKPYQISRHVVQMTDFLGRYVMIEHATKVKGRSFNDAMHEALDAFVLFDEALVPALEAVDAVGATSFLSYYLRNARASKQLVQTSPTGVALSAVFQQATGIPTLGNVNSSWIGGKFSPNYLQTDDLFDEANNITLIDIVMNDGRNLFD